MLQRQACALAEAADEQRQRAPGFAPQFPDDAMQIVQRGRKFAAHLVVQRIDRPGGIPAVARGAGQRKGNALALQVPQHVLDHVFGRLRAAVHEHAQHLRLARVHAMRQRLKVMRHCARPIRNLPVRDPRPFRRGGLRTTAGRRAWSRWRRRVRPWPSLRDRPGDLEQRAAGRADIHRLEVVAVLLLGNVGEAHAFELGLQLDLVFLGAGVERHVVDRAARQHPGALRAGPVVQHLDHRMRAVVVGHGKGEAFVGCRFLRHRHARSSGIRPSR